MSSGEPLSSAESSADALPAPAAWRRWASAYRVELALFLGSFLLFACFSSQRFLRQSAAPHFVYQAKAWLEGRLDVDPEVIPNLEDWACVRTTGGKMTRCEGRILPTDRWYVSFPPFPALLLLPFVALHGYQFNDTSFTVLIAALSIALFYGLLKQLSAIGETRRSQAENAAIAGLLGFGTLFFYCAIRGEVWFAAEIIGVALTCLYLRFAVRAQRPFLAGLVFSMATLTRAPLIFSGLFFLLEAVCPGPGSRIAQLRGLPSHPQPALRRLGGFCLGALPLGALFALNNYLRFGRTSEFGHSFLYNNRVNADIDRFGLFSVHYLARNLDAAFLKLPEITLHPLRLSYDPRGLSLLLTFPLLVFLLVPREKPRLHWPLWLTVAACALPGFFYQNTGYMQFGFRFSLDYTPYLMVLFAGGGWALKNRWVLAASTLAVLVNFWGAVAFRGYTELVRNW